MRILILTQYFPPEIGAPQNRLFELATRLQKNGIDISVLTAMPNYPQMEVYKNYKGKFFFKEQIANLDIYRSWIYVSKNRSIVSRLLNYFSFVFSSLFYGLFIKKKFDYVFCESPPLFLGITAFILTKFKRVKLIFNVSDLWPESAEKLGIIENKFFLKISTNLEEFLYKKSSFISGQTQGIVSNIKNRFPEKTVYWLPNGVDLSYYRFDSTYSKNDFLKDFKLSDTDIIFLYAGIIGYAQGLEVIIKAANLLKDRSDIKFVLLGSGPEKQKLIELKNNYNLENVIFIDAVEKSKMPTIISSITGAIIPLKKLDLFKGAIPSKIFENLAMKKPILLGVEGEALDLFIKEGKCGLSFEPENYNHLAKQIVHLLDSKNLIEELGENGYCYVKEKFNRDIIATKFALALKNIK